MKIMVTGVPGVGKTTLVKALADRLGKKAAGFYTEEMGSRGQRVGFKAVTLEGDEVILARKGLSTGYRLGAYGVDVAAFERVILPAMERAIEAKKLLLVDEIGKMELLSLRFEELVRVSLRRPISILATVGRIRHPFVSEIWGWPDIAKFELTAENREQILVELEQLVKEEH